MNWISIYFICLVCFLLLDGAFIGLIARKAYRSGLGDLLNDKPKPLPGILLYLAYIVAILLYGVWPLTVLLHSAALSSVIVKVAAWGGGLGLICFATYALTAKVLVKGWSTKVVIIDMVWGTIITAVVTTIGYALRV